MPVFSLGNGVQPSLPSPMGGINPGVFGQPAGLTSDQMLKAFGPMVGQSVPGAWSPGSGVSPYSGGLGGQQEMVQAVAMLNEAIQMRKAVDVGYPSPGSAPGTMAALTVESLEGTLTSLTIEERHLKLQRRLFREAAKSMVHQYSRQVSLGHSLLPYSTEGNLHNVTGNPTFDRKTLNLRVFVENGKVTDVANLVQMIGPDPTALAMAQRVHMLNLLQKFERELFFGDSTKCPIAIDGLAAGMEANAPEHVIDMRGDPLDPDNLNEGVARVVRKFGYVDDFFMCTETKKRLGELEHPGLRYIRPVDAKTGMPTAIGLAANKMIAAADDSEPNFVQSVFLDPLGEPEGAAGDTPPIAPVCGAPAAGAHATSKFVMGDAGTYIYKIEAIGASGRSLSTTTAGVAVVAGDRVTSLLTDAAVTNVWYYNIYRSQKDGAADTCRFMKSQAKAAAGATTLIDTNSDIPMTSWSFGLAYNKALIELAKLGMDAVRVPLGKIGLYDWFAIVMVCALALKAPYKFIAFKNCNQQSY